MVGRITSTMREAFARFLTRCEMFSSKTVTRTTKTITVLLNNQILLEGILGRLQLQPGDKITNMQFAIPGGGDYSNMNVDVDTLKLIITVERVNES